MEDAPGSTRLVAPEGEPSGPPGGSPLLDDFIAYLGTDDDPINYHVIVPGEETMMSMKGYSLAPAFVEKGYQVDAEIPNLYQEEHLLLEFDEYQPISFAQVVDRRRQVKQAMDRGDFPTYDKEVFTKKFGYKPDKELKASVLDLENMNEVLLSGSEVESDDDSVADEVTIYRGTTKYHVQHPLPAQHNRTACLGKSRLSALTVVDKDVTDPGLKPDDFCAKCVKRRPGVFPDNVVEHHVDLARSKADVKKAQDVGQG